MSEYDFFLEYPLDSYMGRRAALDSLDSFEDLLGQESFNG